MTRRGPASGAGSGLGSSGFGSAGLVLFADLRVVSVGCALSVVRAVSVERGDGLRAGVRRLRGFRAGGGFTFSVSPGFSTSRAGVSTGFASGVGSGVGVAATSVGGGCGSLILAPTEETRRVPGLATRVSVFGSALSPSAISAPPMIGSNEPPNDKRYVPSSSFGLRASMRSTSDSRLRR